MQRYILRRVFAVGLTVMSVAFGVFLLYGNQFASAGALNVHTYKDLITNSGPNKLSNHTFTFEIKTDVAAGGYFDFDFPAGFNLASGSSFPERLVEMYVDGVPRTASSVLSSTLDQVVITSGNGGSVRYNLNTLTGVSADSEIEFRIGDHTSTALGPSVSFSTSTGTTTNPADATPITNPSTTGNQEITMTVGGASETVYADFLITMIQPVLIENVDTTEEIPPIRFNGLPEGEIGGTTLFVEISLETDEFATCKYSNTASTSYAAMTSVFDDTGKVFHSELVAVVPDALNTYYIRCADDEGNFNIDDYVIQFYAPASPTGQSNTEGGTSGDGTGSGDTGTGDGEGEGGTTGSADGGADTTGGSSGGGGSGGGSGGSSGPDSPDESGGGFENNAGPYPSGDAEVIIRGYAFPGSTVYALVDGYQAENVRANSSGQYSMTISDISRGVYTFGVYAIDSDGTKSSTFSTSFTVTGGRTSNLSNVNIMPSIEVSPDPVDVGETVTMSGYSIPNATITLENQKDGSSVTLKTFETTSGSNGRWSIDIDTSSFSGGTYKVRAKAVGTTVSTDFSDYTYYGVGQNANVPLNADLNRDGRVNLTDFSILLFWWGGDGGTSDPPADINQDGSVSLTDFSILLFNWTG